MIYKQMLNIVSVSEIVDTIINDKVIVIYASNLREENNVMTPHQYRFVSNEVIVLYYEYTSELFKFLRTNNSIEIDFDNFEPYIEFEDHEKVKRIFFEKKLNSKRSNLNSWLRKCGDKLQEGKKVFFIVPFLETDIVVDGVNKKSTISEIEKVNYGLIIDDKSILFGPMNNGIISRMIVGEVNQIYYTQNGNLKAIYAEGNYGNLVTDRILVLSFNSSPVTGFNKTFNNIIISVLTNSIHYQPVPKFQWSLMNPVYSGTVLLGDI